MITATLVVFLAIFGGTAFLALLIWMLFRRRNNSSTNNLVGSSNQTADHNPQYQGVIHQDADETDFVNNSHYPTNENLATQQIASDNTVKQENYKSSANRSDYSAPVDYVSSNSSSSYDSGGSSYDSGSSSSDSSSSSSGN